MKLTVCTPDERTAQVVVDEASTFEDVKNILSVEFGCDPNQLFLSFKGDNSIPDHVTLGSQGVKDEDMMLAIIRRPQGSRPQGNRGPAIPGAAPPQPVPRNIFFPPMGGLQQLFQAPPSNEEVQRRRQQQALIDENLELAMEESPESFASVYMLYIDTEINKVPVKAFVDSGAQTTVMSRGCAERTGIIGLVDPRFAGVAVGVGAARIIGRVHLAPIKIGKKFYNCSFAVLDTAQDLDLLIGLDMLKKYQCSIDLKRDVLHIGTTGDTISFLPESELPAHARLHR